MSLRNEIELLEGMKPKSAGTTADKMNKSLSMWIDKFSAMQDVLTDLEYDKNDASTGFKNPKLDKLIVDAWKKAEEMIKLTDDISREFKRI